MTSRSARTATPGDGAGERVATAAAAIASDR